jgi:hypothetical protein
VEPHQRGGIERQAFLVLFLCSFHAPVSKVGFPDAVALHASAALAEITALLRVMPQPPTPEFPGVSMVRWRYDPRARA